VVAVAVVVVVAAEERHRAEAAEAGAALVAAEILVDRAIITADTGMTQVTATATIPARARADMGKENRKENGND
jgi:hypothetical protein